jgi:phospholipid/cholesterol/gamma-HCH transport system substrate-binding protein
VSGRPLRAVRGACVAAAGALMLSGCGLHGLQSYHLPGGATFGQSSYDITVIFDDVTSLQPQSSVRVGNVPVGDVESVAVCKIGSSGCPAPSPGSHGFAAKVKCRIKKSVSLPANTVATLEQTSLLGEKYVALTPPAGQSQGHLPTDGSALLAEGSSTQPDIEDVFGALSLLLNGGGVEQLQTINAELAATLTGRESNVRDLFHQLNTLVGGLDSRRSAIIRALESLDRLSKTLIRERTTVATALTDIAPGLKVLADREPDLTHLLEALSRLGVVAHRVIHETKADTIADLSDLNPILTRFADAGSYLPHALEVVLDYPFPRNVTHGIFGDYTGLLADVDLNASIKTLTGLQLPLNTPTATTKKNGAKHGSRPAHGLKKPKLPLKKLPGRIKGVIPGLPGITGELPLPSKGGGGLLDLLLGGLQ